MKPESFGFEDIVSGYQSTSDLTILIYGENQQLQRKKHLYFTQYFHNILWIINIDLMVNKLIICIMSKIVNVY
jgi:hypothetical protein